MTSWKGLGPAANDRKKHQKKQHHDSSDRLAAAKTIDESGSRQQRKHRNRRKRQNVWLPRMNGHNQPQRSGNLNQADHASCPKRQPYCAVSWFGRLAFGLLRTDKYPAESVNK